MKFIVNPSTLSGSITIPPSKSHTMRAILFASLAQGVSHVQQYLSSPDTDAMINACRQLGAAIEVSPSVLTIRGVEGQPKIPPNIIDAGNSGQVLRFMASIAALTSGYTILTGDESIRYSRPMQPLLDGLNQLGAMAVSTKNDGRAPIIVKGPIQAGHVEISGEDSQPVSALLMAAAFLPGKTTLKINNPGEKPWVELTLDWFRRLGIQYECNNYNSYIVYGSACYQGFDYTVPGDFSSAAFPIIAALITDSEITLENIDMSDIQGDKAIIPALEKMGAVFEYDQNKKMLHIRKSVLLGGELNINDYIDAVAILAVLGCFTREGLKITGAEIAQYKESNRLIAMAEELKKMGADVTVLKDGLHIQPSVLKGALVKSYDDHRIAMSLAVAAFSSQGESIISDACCVAKSFPDFVKNMQNLNSNIQELA